MLILIPAAIGKLMVSYVIVNLVVDSAEQVVDKVKTHLDSRKEVEA